MSPTYTLTPTSTPADTPMPTHTPTPTQTYTPTPTQTSTPAKTPTSTPTPTSMPTPTPSPTARPTDTPTPEPTPTPTPLPRFTISAIVFFDYNGDGVKAENEPPIQGAAIRVAGLATESGQDGRYELLGVPYGTHDLHISKAGFRYISLSIAEFRPVAQGISLKVLRDLQQNIGFMEGFLTLPFKEGTSYDIWTYFDLDPSQGIRRYDGRTDYEAKIANNHPVIDYKLQIGTPVLAAAPGRVIFTGVDTTDTSCPGTITVRIIHNAERQYETAYNHLNSVGEGIPQFVKRGQLIGYSGDSGECSKGKRHLELDLEPWGWEEGPYRFHLDPYKDETNPNSINLWTKLNDPQYP